MPHRGILPRPPIRIPATSQTRPRIRLHRLHILPVMSGVGLSGYASVVLGIFQNDARLSLMGVVTGVPPPTALYEPACREAKPPARHRTTRRRSGSTLGTQGACSRACHFTEAWLWARMQALAVGLAG